MIMAMPTRIDLGEMQDLENLQFVVHLGSRAITLLTRDVRVNATLGGRRIIDVEVALTAFDPGEDDTGPPR